MRHTSAEILTRAKLSRWFRKLFYHQAASQQSEYNYYRLTHGSVNYEMLNPMAIAYKSRSSLIDAWRLRISRDKHKMWLES